jgi:NitT/TauT family transport system substrate-binding protein
MRRRIAAHVSGTAGPSQARPADPCAAAHLSNLLQRIGRRAAALLAVLGVALLAACAKEVPQTIRIGINSYPAYELLYLAQEKGFYRQEGVDVKIVEFSSLSDVTASMANGQIDGAATTLVDLVLMQARYGIGARAVLVIAYSAGADMLLARAPIGGLADLRGKTVGLEIDSLGMLVLGRALEVAGLAPTDLKLVNMDQASGERALAGGQIDALVTYPPFATRLLANPTLRKLFDTSSVPGEVIDVLAFSDALIDGRPEDVRRIARAYTRAQEFLRTERAEALAIMARREDIEVQEFAAALEGDIRLLGESDQAPYFADAGLIDQQLSRAHAYLRSAARIDRDGHAALGQLRVQSAWRAKHLER